MNRKELIVISSNDKLTNALNNCFGSGEKLALLESAGQAGTETSDSTLAVVRVARQDEAFKRLSEKFGEVNLGNTPDTVVFVDLLLEDCDGLSLVEKLRNNYHCLPIVAFMPEQDSNQAPLEAIQLRTQAENCGADSVLLAPFNLREVMASVTRLLSEQRDSALLENHDGAALHGEARSAIS